MQVGRELTDTRYLQLLGGSVRVGVPGLRVIMVYKEEDLL